MGSGASGPDPELGLAVLRSVALVLALGSAFLLDDPARHTTAVVPTRRPVRVGLRLAFVAPLAALWWTAAVLLVPEEARPPVGAVTLEAAAAAVLALAGAAAVVRRTEVAEPGKATAVGVLTAAVAAWLLPGRWALFVPAGDPRWEAAHQRWAVLLAVAVLVVGVCVIEPVRSWRVGRLPVTRLSPGH
jgi:hypothetical protein